MKGQSLVEAAVGLLLALIVLLAAIEVVNYAVVTERVSQASWNATRVATQGKSEAIITAIALSSANGDLDPDLWDVYMIDDNVITHLYGSGMQGVFSGSIPDGAIGVHIYKKHASFIGGVWEFAGLGRIHRFTVLRK